MSKKKKKTEDEQMVIKERKEKEERCMDVRMCRFCSELKLRYLRH